MGIEPTYPAWEAGVLPMNYARIFNCRSGRHSSISFMEQYSLHIVQTSSNRGWDERRYSLAFSGSIERAICFCQSRLFLARDICRSGSKDPFMPLAISAA